MTDIELITQPIFRKQMLYRARQKLKGINRQHDAEDVVQDAYMMYLKYKDRLNNENPERLFNWLVSNEASRFIKQKIKSSYITLLGDFEVHSYSTEDMDLFDYKALKKIYIESKRTYRKTDYYFKNEITRNYLELHKSKLIVTLNNPKKKKQKQFLKIHVKIQRVKDYKKDRNKTYEYYKIT